MCFFLVNAQLESLYICISLDYLMTLQDFFISGLPTGGTTEVRSRSSSATTSNTDKQDDLSEKSRLKIQQKAPQPSIASAKSLNNKSRPIFNENFSLNNKYFCNSTRISSIERRRSRDTRRCDCQKSRSYSSRRST